VQTNGGTTLTGGSSRSAPRRAETAQRPFLSKETSRAMGRAQGRDAGILARESRNDPRSFVKVLTDGRSD
jgi:hypothetical protein